MAAVEHARPIETPDHAAAPDRPDLPDFMPWVLLMQAVMEAKRFEASNAVLPTERSGKIKKIALRIKKSKA